MSGHTEVQMSDRLKGKIHNCCCATSQLVPAILKKTKVQLCLKSTQHCVFLYAGFRDPLPCAALRVEHSSRIIQKKGCRWASAEVGEEFIIRIRWDGDRKTQSRLENFWWVIVQHECPSGTHRAIWNYKFFQNKLEIWAQSHRQAEIIEHTAVSPEEQEFMCVRGLKVLQAFLSLIY